VKLFLCVGSAPALGISPELATKVTLRRFRTHHLGQATFKLFEIRLLATRH
jgi:hypothetical protein